MYYCFMWCEFSKKFSYFQNFLQISLLEPYTNKYGISAWIHEITGRYMKVVDFPEKMEKEYKFSTYSSYKQSVQYTDAKHGYLETGLGWNSDFAWQNLRNSRSISKVFTNLKYFCCVWKKIVICQFEIYLFLTYFK